MARLRSLRSLRRKQRRRTAKVPARVLASAPRETRVLEAESTWVSWLGCCKCLAVAVEVAAKARAKARVLANGARWAHAGPIECLCTVSHQDSVALHCHMIFGETR